jgi:hypothetical protein
MAAAASPPGGPTYSDYFPNDLLAGPLKVRERQQLAATQGIGSLA